MSELVLKLLDLHKQATVERSHYYVGSLAKEAADLIEKHERLIALYRLRETLRVHPATEAIIRLKEVIDEIKQMEETL